MAGTDIPIMAVLVSYDELVDTVQRALVGLGFEGSRAGLAARLIADASRDGVASHGLNFVPRLVTMIRAGVIDVQAEPVSVAAAGAVERWDGRRGPGNLNAHACMARAIALAQEHGVGCVALSNTNHWMRGGTYGWQAADAGAIGICWTNTMPNLPPWGATKPRVGNNPLVIAIPRAGGHLVLDMALSQFSFGALAAYRLRGESLPVAGGFDERGALTHDPAAIERSGRALPIGFWKGSGLAIMLDAMAAMLAGGRPTHEITARADAETGLSQVFIAFDPMWCAGCGNAGVVDHIVAHLSAVSGAEAVRYPGERTLAIREKHLREGVPVDPSVWRFVKTL
jgi:3-dehydro-L-gulonate 2-dehydrogenase